jgi:hypothetical protein
MVAESRVDFNKFEREVFRVVCHLGCDLIRDALERYDSQIFSSRDRKIYQSKGLRQTCLKTVMGEVIFKRRMYEVDREDSTKQYVYLLDEAIGKTGSGFFSDLLLSMIAKAACESSYRSAARSVSELTGQSISHTAAWSAVQHLGERLNKQELSSSSLAKQGSGKGALESKVLFEEIDGIKLKLQGKSRKEHGVSKEMKVAIAYNGAEKIGKKRYRLTNKVATSNFEDVKKFRYRKEGTIAATYNVDEIETRLLNGDGAKWINESAAPDTHFQLDHFHISQAITRNISNEDVRITIRELLYSKQIDLMLDVIEAYSNSTEDEKERENTLELYSYFKNNKDYLIPCHRRGLDLPKPPKNTVYRRMGAMESNIFTIIGNRMKGRRACWSIDGGNNLARLLCLKATGKLSQSLQMLATVILPERYAEEVEVKMSAASVPIREGKGYNGFHQFLVPPSMPWLKDIAALRPLC